MGGVSKLTSLALFLASIKMLLKYSVGHCFLWKVLFLEMNIDEQRQRFINGWWSSFIRLTFLFPKLTLLLLLFMFSKYYFKQLRNLFCARKSFQLTAKVSMVSLQQNWKNFFYPNSWCFKQLFGWSITICGRKVICIWMKPIMVAIIVLRSSHSSSKLSLLCS